MPEVGRDRSHPAAPYPEFPEQRVSPERLPEQPERCVSPERLPEQRLARERLPGSVRRTHRKAARALRDSDGPFRTIFQHAGVGIGMVNLASEPVAANPALVRMFGSEGLLVNPRPLTELAHPKDAGPLRARWAELAAGRRDSFRAEVRFVRPDGSVLWTRFTASLVYAENDEPDYVVGVIEDITEPT